MVFESKNNYTTINDSMTTDLQDKYQNAFEMAGKSKASLYQLAALEITGNRFGAGRDNDDDNRRRVQKWWADHHGILKKHLCTEQLRFLYDPTDNAREKSLIIVAVADCLAGVALGISPLTAATLVVFFGFRKLCDE